jgi:hypothetical protein
MKVTFQTRTLRLIAAAVTVAALSIVCLTAVTKKRDFRGKFEIQFFKIGAGGQWELFDKWISTVSSRLSVADVVFGKEFTIDNAWEGRSEKGRQISARLSKPGKAKVNLTEGTLDVEIPFEVSIDGTKLNHTFAATTETVRGAFGTISGRRAVINESERSLTVTVVGSKEISIPAHLLKSSEIVNRVKADDALQGQKGEKAKSPDSSSKFERSKKLENSSEKILVTGRLEGKFKAVD